MSSSHRTFAFIVGLYIDDGDRPGLRIHLQLCNIKFGCKIIDKHKCVNSTRIRILWAKDSLAAMQYKNGMQDN
jgi:hypothetical protein